MLKILVAMATHRLKIWQILPSDNSKSTGNIFLKLDIWVDGSLEIMHVLSFLPILKKILVVLATNRLKTWQI
jgi:hypothetical protein